MLRTPLFLLLLLLNSLLTNPATGQDTWRQLALMNSPGSRYAHAMAYDHHRGVAVLFGGRTKQNILNDTWEFNGGGWYMVPALNPPPGISSDPEMAYDSRRRVMVMIRRTSQLG